MRYLQLKNHAQYQHYSARNPPWVKLYRTVPHNYDLRQMTTTSRLCFIYLTILAAETDNRIPDDLKYLSERFGFSVQRAHLTPLIDCGMVLASSDSTLLAPDAFSSVSVSVSDSSSSEGEKILKKRGNGHRPISDDDKPTEKHFAFAKTLGIDPGPEWGKFKNYCLAHNKHYANFEAAFRNWLANAKEMKGARHAL